MAICRITNKLHSVKELSKNDKIKVVMNSLLVVILLGVTGLSNIVFGKFLAITLKLPSHFYTITVVALVCLILLSVYTSYYVSLVSFLFLSLFDKSKDNRCH
jgi:hypothetical protein